jgi:hypothetical protein
MKSKAVAIFLLCLVACRGDDVDDPPGIKYVKEVLDVMEKNSLHKYTLNWTQIRDETLVATGDGRTPEKVKRGLQTALSALGDNHSFIVRNGEYINSFNHAGCFGNSDGNPPVPDNIGYIRITATDGSDLSFGSDLQEKIKEQDKEEMLGWIVDLRGNSGGNMWPMLAGVGPILGNNIVGYFIDADNKSQAYQYAGGKASIDGNILSSVQNPYTLINSSPKVAVLTDHLTASSGEAMTVAFVGRPNTRSFGVSTCGLSTANAGYSLSDKSTLYLTVAVLADRNKNEFGGPIVPDVTLNGDQEVVDAAVEWLTEN